MIPTMEPWTETTATAADALAKAGEGMMRGSWEEAKELFETLAVRYTVTGKQTGDLMAIPPTGREVSMTGITIMRYEGGKVVERWDSDDSAEVLARLRGEP